MSEPGHVIEIMILLDQLLPHSRIVHAFGIVAENQHITAGGIFRIEIEVSALHGGHDVARTSADALGDFTGIFRTIFDDELEHFAEDILLGHGLGGDVDGRFGRCSGFRCCTVSCERHAYGQEDGQNGFDVFHA